MTEATGIILACVVVGQAVVICVLACYVAKVLASERDHLLVRNAAEHARVVRARQPAVVPRRVEPTPADYWAHDLHAEQMEMMGEGEPRNGVEPMVEGMNGV